MSFPNPCGQLVTFCKLDTQFLFEINTATEYRQPKCRKRRIFSPEHGQKLMATIYCLRSYLHDFRDDSSGITIHGNNFSQPLGSPLSEQDPSPNFHEFWML